MSTDYPRLMFLYLGRRGALVQMTLDLAHVALSDPGIAASVCVSRQNENFADFEKLGPGVLGIDTYSTGAGMLLQAWRIPLLRRRLARRIRNEKIGVVFDLMPHVWSPLMISAIRKAGARYVAVVHDASAHPGDISGTLNGWIYRAVTAADHVVTLSAHVTRELQRIYAIPAERMTTLFLPDFDYGVGEGYHHWAPDRPLHLLFMGRIMPYKGLDILLDAVETLDRAGRTVKLGIFGAGDISKHRGRLEDLNAEIVNRWLSDADIADALKRYDAMVLAHTEASQSGLVSTAFGAGLPVITTPVGGLADQVEDGETGLVAARADAPALKAAIEKMLLDRALHARLSANIARGREQRSVSRFARACAGLAERLRPGSGGPAA